MSEQKTKSGPKPERVKTDKDWEQAIKEALQKKRPEGGWPEPDKKEKR